jgi:hypothetical protein
MRGRGAFSDERLATPLEEGARENSLEARLYIFPSFVFFPFPFFSFFSLSMPPGSGRVLSFEVREDIQLECVVVNSEAPDVAEDEYEFGCTEDGATGRWE